MDPDEVGIATRLRSATGHLQAVGRMFEAGASCEQTVQQLYAVQAALQEIGCLLIEQELDANLRDLSRCERPEARIEAIRELARWMKRISR